MSATGVVTENLAITEFSKNGGIIIKSIYAQLGMIGVIWVGMLFFFNEMTDTSKLIFYVVTSWFLFLIVMAVKAFIRQRKEKTN